MTIYTCEKPDILDHELSFIDNLIFDGGNKEAKWRSSGNTIFADCEYAPKDSIAHGITWVRQRDIVNTVLSNIETELFPGHPQKELIFPKGESMDTVLEAIEAITQGKLPPQHTMANAEVKDIPEKGRANYILPDTVITYFKEMSIQDRLDSILGLIGTLEEDERKELVSRMNPQGLPQNLESNPLAETKYLKFIFVTDEEQQFIIKIERRNINIYYVCFDDKLEYTAKGLLELNTCLQNIVRNGYFKLEDGDTFTRGTCADLCKVIWGELE